MVKRWTPGYGRGQHIICVCRAADTLCAAWHPDRHQQQQHAAYPTGRHQSKSQTAVRACRALACPMPPCNSSRHAQKAVACTRTAAEAGARQPRRSTSRGTTCEGTTTGAVSGVPALCRAGVLALCRPRLMLRKCPACTLRLCALCMQYWDLSRHDTHSKESKQAGTQHMCLPAHLYRQIILQAW